MNERTCANEGVLEEVEDIFENTPVDFVFR